MEIRREGCDFVVVCIQNLFVGGGFQKIDGRAGEEPINCDLFIVSVFLCNTVYGDYGSSGGFRDAREGTILDVRLSYYTQVYLWVVSS